MSNLCDSMFVWHACGRFGYDIPWAKWQTITETTPVAATAANYLTTVADLLQVDLGIIFLYSIEGQPIGAAPLIAANAEAAKDRRGWAGALCIDPHIRGRWGVVWADVYADLLAMHKAGRQ